jgi:hypothetical protein
MTMKSGVSWLMVAETITLQACEVFEGTDLDYAGGLRGLFMWWCSRINVQMFAMRSVSHQGSLNTCLLTSVFVSSLTMLARESLSLIKAAFIFRHHIHNKPLVTVRKAV